MDPNSEGPLYCAEQIKIPAELPDILKEFTKAAIRTQPVDLLQWSAAYFQALAKGEVPPVKTRLEQPLESANERLGGITKGILAALNKQIGTKEKVSVDELEEKWLSIGCTKSKFDELIAIGDFSDEIEWQKYLSLACTSLEKSLPDALSTLCHVLSPDDEGGPARIPLQQFEELYSFLAAIDGGISKEQIASVVKFLKAEADRYDGRIGPREFLHGSCPRLDSRSPH